MRLKGALCMLSLTALFAAGCGVDDDTSDSGADDGTSAPSVVAPATTADGTSTMTTPSETTGSDGSEPPRTVSTDGLNLAATLRFGISRLNPPTWDPHKVGQEPFNLTLYPMYDRILDADPTGAPVPSIAESWEFGDADTALTLHIRDGVLFHDGSPVDAAAVKANLERQIRGGVEMLNASQLAGIESIDTPDGSTVVLNLSHSNAALPAILAGRAGSLVCPAQFDSPDLTTNPCGAGPFRFVSHRDDDRTVYERFEDYWNIDHVLVAGLEFLYVPDEQTRINSFQAGQFDATFVSGPSIDAAERAGIDVNPMPTLQFYGLDLNRAVPPFDNAEVRTAINQAIDRQAIVDALVFGQAMPAGGMFPPSYFAYDESSPDPYWTHDPDAAQALIAQSGAANLTFTCEVSNATSLFPAMAQAIQAQLADVGVTMNIETVTLPTYLTERNKDCQIGGWPGTNDPSIAFQTLFSAEGYYNVSGEASPAVTAAYEATLTPGDRREAAINNMAGLALEQSLVTPVFFPYRTYLQSDQVVGLDVFPVDSVTRFIDVGLKE